MLRKLIGIVAIFFAVSVLAATLAHRPYAVMQTGATAPGPALEGRLFLDTDASENGDVMCYANGAWRALNAEDSPPPVAFPGAEGFGATADGWRDAKATVIHVTTLADDQDSPPAGSLRAALGDEGGGEVDNDPKYIVFDVGGTIEVDDQMWMGSNTYIAGQTAPGGITFYGGYLLISGTYHSDGTTQEGDTTFADICIRHVRFRSAHAYDGSRDTFRNFAASNISNLIVDHCSFSGGGDETPGIYLATHWTFQWCTTEEMARWGQGGAAHSEGHHDYGFLSGKVDYASGTFHHNLHANHRRRMPRLDNDDGGGYHLINNVIFNWVYGPVLFKTNVGINVDVVNNCWVVGATTVAGGFRDGPLIIAAEAPDDSIAMYLAGNKMETNGDSVWEDVTTAAINHLENTTQEDAAWDSGVETAVTLQDATDAYADVLAKAGAWPRDWTTTRTLTEVGEEDDGGGWGLRGPYEYIAEDADGPTAKANDDDEDGINDDWEDANGLDKEDATDALEFVVSGEYGGYQNIEWYLATLADAKEEGAVGTTYTVTVAPDDADEGAVVTNISNFSLDEYAYGGYNNSYEHNTISFGTATYREDSIVIAKAKPAPGHSFTAWSGAPVDGDTGNEVQFPLTENRSVEATFADLTVRTISVTISPGGKGVVSGAVCVGSDDDGEYFDGEIVTLAATATDADYYFDHWDLDGQDFDEWDNPVIQFPAAGDITITAVYTNDAGTGGDFVIDTFEDGNYTSTWSADLDWTYSAGRSYLADLSGYGGGNYGMRADGAIGFLRLGDWTEADTATIPAGATTLNFEIYNIDDGTASLVLDGDWEGFSWRIASSYWIQPCHRRMRSPTIATASSTTWRIPLALLRNNAQTLGAAVGSEVKMMYLTGFLGSDFWGGEQIAIDSVHFGRAKVDGYSETERDPVANAGPDQTVTDVDGDGDIRVWLDGSKSYDGDAQVVTYGWSWNGGVDTATGTCPAVVLDDSETITLTVTDEDENTDADTVDITLR